MRCALFDWRDEVQKKSKKQDIELAALLFLVGLLLFIYPVVNQVSSYHTDEEEYYYRANKLVNSFSRTVLFVPDWMHSYFAR